MQTKSEILLLFCGLVFLCTSCGTTKKVQKNNSEEITTTREIESTKTNLHPPVYIEGGVMKKIFYVGMPNSLKVYAEGGITEHLEVFANGGKLITVDAKKGLYSYTDKSYGLAVEIVAKDTASGTVVSEMFDVVQIPAPEAYAWRYGEILKGNYIEFTTEAFKANNFLVLQHKDRVPIRCDASSYTVTQINATGKRTVHENESKNGLFDETTLAMLSTTQKGDIFVFEKIKTNCSTFPIKNIVYIIK